MGFQFFIFLKTYIHLSICLLQALNISIFGAKSSILAQSDIIKFIFQRQKIKIIYSKKPKKEYYDGIIFNFIICCQVFLVVFFCFLKGSFKWGNKYLLQIRSNSTQFLLFLDSIKYGDIDYHYECNLPCQLV